MDSASFDALVQLFGKRSRRDGLRLLIGTAAGGILSGLPGVAVEAGRKRRKKKKCKPNCKGKQCGRDGCGGSCGKCPNPYCMACVKGRCIGVNDGEPCDPNFERRCWAGLCSACGVDGGPCCGGAFGICWGDGAKCIDNGCSGADQNFCGHKYYDTCCSWGSGCYEGGKCCPATPMTPREHCMDEEFPCV